MILARPYVNFLIDYDLTQEQFLFLELIYRRETDLIKRYKKKFPNEEGSMISGYLIKDLVNKEFIYKEGNHYKLGEKFLNIYVDNDMAVDEVYDIYPTTIMSSNGVELPLIAMDRKIFREIYINKIMGSAEEHREVLKDIQYGIDNNLITMGINKFVTSQYWKALRKRRIDDMSANVTSVDKFDESF